MLATACGGGAEDAVGAPQDFEPVVETGSNAADVESEPVAAEVTSTTSPSTSSPESLALAEDTPLEADLPRETAEGIVISREETTADFGNGEEATSHVTAKYRQQGPGVFLDLTSPADPTVGAPDRQLALAFWSIDSGIFVAVIETTPAVGEIRLVGKDGSTDVTVADERGYAFAAVRADGLDDVTIEALNDSGEVLARCEQDEDLNGLMSC